MTTSIPKVGEKIEIICEERWQEAIVDNIEGEWFTAHLVYRPNWTITCLIKFYRSDWRWLQRRPDKA